MIKLCEMVQPHCAHCKEPFWESDLVCTDTMFEQIQHINCFIFKQEYVKQSGTFSEIVRNHAEYQKFFLVMKKGLPLH